MELVLYIALGFCAEIIDGTAGMAYGVSCNTFLRTSGVPSAVSSACVHASEIFTTLASGTAHWRRGNVDGRLLKMLLIAGIPGGVLGAWALSAFQSNALDIAIDVYLVVMGAVILAKGLRGRKTGRDFGRYVYPLGFAGGLTDAMGGGGWGPVVTSTLLASGHEPRVSIGTVNAAEFFVTVAETAAFVLLLSGIAQYWMVVAGLIVGGVAAAPLAAKFCSVIPARAMLVFVGALVVVLNMCKLAGHIG